MNLLPPERAPSRLPSAEPPPAATRPRAEPAPAPPPGPRVATRGQRIALFAGVGAALLLGLWMFSAILTPFVLAAVIAYFLDPIATRLTRIGVPRTLAALLLVLGMVAVALLGLLLLYPLLIAQVTVLLQRLPSYVLGVGQAVREALIALSERLGPEMFDQRLQDLAVGQAGAIISFLGTSLARLIGGGVALFNVFTLVTVTPVVAFYLLRDWPRMLARINAWLPRRSAATLRQLAKDTDRVLSAWLRGQLLCCALLAVYYAAALSAVGLELGLSVGLMAGLLSFIPYIGSITGLITALALALAQFGTWDGVLVVLAIFLAGQVIEGYIIYPRLLGDRVELHAVWVIFALFAGGVAFGFLGVLLAVPIAAVVGVIARYWLRRYLESPLYLDPPRTGL
ncbi:AI-2E family transporter [Paracraurococcus lichenis]|uniref:AI-2E family transporter n=1 Tax=Paracraurococcus lichenis TaxID=3064888 RepID=A0ABT9E2U1_9PROT|nr:AI-2E family transporter [Paracraurococcus sp. LOR1-02]MDO9710477.1 AI-2E family transporter [Paracraurococcus sp. LOR1-02]